MFKKLKQILNLVRLTRIQAKRRGESTLIALIWMCYLLTFGRFSPNEIQAYAPHLRFYRSQRSALVSKENSLRRLRKLNSGASETLTEDKHVFYQHCERHNIATPLHLFTTQSADPRYAKLKMLSAEELIHTLPAQFVTKDRRGVYGSGFSTFRLAAGNYLCDSGEVYSPMQLLAHFDRPNAGALIVQERAFDHPELSALSQTLALQTIRLTTRHDGAGEVEYLYFLLKVLANGNTVDNFKEGRSGNLMAFGDIHSGILHGAVMHDPSGLGLAIVEAHPESGRSIHGFQVPCWQATLELARKAHRSLAGFKEIGWDIAVTERGPVIIEGNIWYDPPPPYPSSQFPTSHPTFLSP